MVPVPVSFECFYNLSVDKRLSEWEWPEADYGRTGKKTILSKSSVHLNDLVSLICNPGSFRALQLPQAVSQTVELLHLIHGPSFILLRTTPAAMRLLAQLTQL